MIKFDLKGFADVYSHISVFAQHITDTKCPDNEEVPQIILKKQVFPQLDIILKRSEELELDVSVRMIIEMKVDFIRSCNYLKLKNSLEQLRSAIRREMENEPLVLSIRREKVKYYQNTAPFGDRVLERFPVAKFDIEEASTCFTLARYTACVMHLQKVAEAGMRAFVIAVNKLKIIDGRKEFEEENMKRNPNWGKALNAMREEFHKRKKSGNWRDDEVGNFCTGVRPFLSDLQIAWRNPAMHLGSRYDEELSEDIYSVIKAFMRFLAEYIDEKGNFRPKSI